MLTFQSGDETFYAARGGAAANQTPTSADTILHLDIGTEGTSDSRQPEASLNTQIQFSETDFTYQDAEHTADPNVDAFTQLNIYTAPHFGELRHGGTLITQAVIDLQPDGYVVQIDQIDDLRFTAAAGESGIAQFGFRVNDGHDNSDLLYTMRLHVDVGPQVIISTDGDGPADANLPAYEDNHALSLGGPDLNLFANDTRGDWTVAFEQQTGGSVDGLHFVSDDTLVAGAQLLTGDVLFSISENELTIDLKSFDGNDPGLTSVQDEDILVYRDNQGTIEYYRLVDLPTSNRSAVAFTLAESNTIIGDQFIAAGDLLYVDKAGDANQIQHLRFDDSGNPVTSLLIDGDDLNIDEKISGLELIERQTTIGNRTFASGTLIVSVNDFKFIADNGVEVDPYDLTALTFTKTSINGTAEANGVKIFGGVSFGTGRRNR